MQTYSIPEIQALKKRQDGKVVREGEFAKVKAYQLDDQISYEGTTGPVNAADNAATSNLKVKNKNKL